MSCETGQAEKLAAEVPDGASLALAPDYSGCAMAVVRALLRRPARALHLIGVPQLGLQADLLIGAGCVRSIETAAVSLGEFGPAPAFERAYREGRIEVVESTCPAIHAALQASEKGVPFLPLRGILGSDLMEIRSDWKVIDNPFGEDDPLLLVPAIRPDVALFHAALADASGNVWIGVRRELMTMAHAARRTLVSVERIVDTDLLADDRWAAGTIPSLYVDRVAPVKGGSWPLGLGNLAESDRKWIARYASEARDGQGFARMLREFMEG